MFPIPNQISKSFPLRKCFFDEKAVLQGILVPPGGTAAPNSTMHSAAALALNRWGLARGPAARPSATEGGLEARIRLLGHLATFPTIA